MAKPKKTKPEKRTLPAEDLAFEEFMAAWSTIPPLIRAATAAPVLFLLDRRAAEAFKESETLRLGGLQRRAEVYLGCAKGYLYLHQFIKFLIRSADDEAERLGVQVDIRERKV